MLQGLVSTFLVTQNKIRMQVNFNTIVCDNYDISLKLSGFVGSAFTDVKIFIFIVIENHGLKESDFKKIIIL